MGLRFNQQKESLMNKLLTVLLASFFAAGAAMAATSGSGAGALSGSTSGSTSGSVSGSTSNNTNTNTALSNNANLNSNTNTNTNTVNVYGPGSNTLARQQANSGQPSTGVSMMPGHNRTSGTRTAQAEPRSTRSCPPGLAKKDNGCMPPGLASRDRDDTRVMGNTGSHSTRHHRLSLRHRRDER
jgi:hypothetical protein